MWQLSHPGLWNFSETERVVLLFLDEYNFHELRPLRQRVIFQHSLVKDLRQSIADVNHFDVRIDH